LQLSTLRFDGDTRKPHQPVVISFCLFDAFERFIVIIAASKNRGRQSRERRLTVALRQSFLRNCSSDASIAISKGWMLSKYR